MHGIQASLQNYLAPQQTHNSEFVSNGLHEISIEKYFESILTAGIWHKD